MDCRCQAGESSRAHRDVSCAYLICVSFTPCFTQIVTRARDEASDYRLTYSQPIPLKVSQVSSWDEVDIYLYSSLPPPLTRTHTYTHTHKHLTDRVSSYVHVFTLYNGARPFGCSVMFGAYGPEGPRLYMTDPSGVAWVRLHLIRLRHL